MKILVTGSRNMINVRKMEETLDKYLEDSDILVHGNARGADRLADKVAKGRGCETRPYPADWARYGRGAGPIRNKEMLVAEQPDLVIAFWTGINKGSGTFDMIQRAVRAGVEVTIVPLGMDDLGV